MTTTRRCRRGFNYGKMLRAVRPSVAAGLDADRRRAGGVPIRTISSSLFASAVASRSLCKCSSCDHEGKT